MVIPEQDWNDGESKSLNSNEIFYIIFIYSFVN